MNEYKKKCPANQIFQFSSAIGWHHVKMCDEGTPSTLPNYNLENSFGDALFNSFFCLLIFEQIKGT